MTRRLGVLGIALMGIGSLGCSSNEVGSAGFDTTEEQRAAWVTDELEAANAHLDDDIRERKFDKMSDSAFTFYRGSNHLFWADLGSDERLEEFGGGKKTVTWVQGDLHVNNYGAFADDDGRIIYDLNDFDESFVADYQHDVWRAAVSLVLVARTLGYADEETQAFVDAFSESYLDSLDDYRDGDAEKDFVLTKENAYGRLDEFLETVELEESRDKMLSKWTVLENGQRTLRTEYKKLAETSDAVARQIRDGWGGYGESLSGGLDYDDGYFAIKSIADRLDAGIGSLGTPRYYVLIEGLTTSPDDDIILDLKRASAPTGASYVKVRVEIDDEAERAVLAQKALGVKVDDHLGVIVLDDGSYTVRERSPFKETFEAEEELTSVTRFTKLAEQWGLVLATDHARADEDFDNDFVSSSFEHEVHDETDGHHDEFRALVWSIAQSYGTQVASDYATFLTLL